MAGSHCDAHQRLQLVDRRRRRRTESRGDVARRCERVAAVHDANATSETSDTGEARIVACWHSNARAWTAAVRERRIDSRTLVTDQAIVDAVRSRSPRRVLD